MNIDPFAEIRSEYIVTNRSRNNKYTELQSAAEYIYVALEDPKCAEVAEAFKEYLDHTSKSINISLLDRDLYSLIKPSLTSRKVLHIKQSGGSLKSCIIIVMSILLVSLSVYLSSLYAENAHYEMYCTQYSELLDPTKPKSILVGIYKMYKLSLNKAQIEHCKSIEQRRSQMIYSFVESGNKLTKDFVALIKTIGSVTVLLIMLFSKGINGIICLAGKYIDLDEICGIDCNKINKKPNITKKSASNSSSKSSSQEEE